MKRIAIIDGGINVHALQKMQSIAAMKIRDGNISIDNHIYSNFSHGSICALIIDKYLHENMELVCLNIRDEHDRGNVNDLIVALNWCLNNQIAVINLSCGTVDREDGDILRRYIKEQSWDECILVASQSNDNFCTYPACLPQVIGVRCDPTLFNFRFCMVDQNDYGIDIAASAIHKIYNGTSYSITRPSNSFATPMICALILNSIGSTIKNGKKEVMKILSDL